MCVCVLFVCFLFVFFNILEAMLALCHLWVSIVNDGNKYRPVQCQVGLRHVNSAVVFFFAVLAHKG